MNRTLVAALLSLLPSFCLAAVPPPKLPPLTVRILSSFEKVRPGLSPPEDPAPASLELARGECEGLQL